VHPHLFRTALSRAADVVEYQVRQTPAGAAIAVRCTAPVSLDGLRDRIATALAHAGLDRPGASPRAVQVDPRLHPVLHPVGLDAGAVRASDVPSQ
jgi:hypothetical protein